MGGLPWQQLLGPSGARCMLFGNGYSTAGLTARMTAFCLLDWEAYTAAVFCTVVLLLSLG